MELLIPEVVTAGLGAVATYGIVAYAERGHKRKNPWLTPPTSPTPGKKTRLDYSSARTSMPRTMRPTRFRRRRTGRRKFPSPRARVKRVLRSARRRRFKRAVTRILVRKLETFKKHYTETSFTLAPGNGTTAMNVRVFAPWQSAFAQGDTSASIHGSKVHLWKFMWRLNIKGLLAGDVHVQILFIKSDIQMDVTAANTDINNEGQTMGATTDVDSVPTQVPPNSNIPLFDVTASPGQFSGLSPVTKFNNDNISILKIWNFKLHGFGQAGTDPFIDTTLTFPFNKDVQIQETQETIDGVPRFFGPTGRNRHSDQYYILVRTWGQDFVSASSAIDVDHRGLLMWKEV